jgi:hypothetical protein
MVEKLSILQIFDIITDMHNRFIFQPKRPCALI